MSDITDATPDTGNSAEQQDNAQDTNWEQRFKDTQGSYTKSQQELAAERALWEDETAALARMAERFPHLFEDDTDDDLDEDIVESDEDRPLTRAEFEQWKRETADQERVKSSAQQFEDDLKAVTNGRELDKWDEKAVRFAVSQGDIKNADDLKAAVDEIFARHESTKPRPRAPHVVTNGKAGTGAPDFDSMSEAEINRYMAEQVQARTQQ